MITVKDYLIALAETDSERALVTAWMDEGRHCARQQAWEDLDARLARGTMRFRW